MGRALKGKVSSRKLAKLLGVPRSTLLYSPKLRKEDEELIKEMGAILREPGKESWGYRRITAYLRRKGWRVNHKRVYRLYKLFGLSLPKPKPRKRKLQAKGFEVKATKPNDVWCSDIFWVKGYKVLFLLDEASRMFLGFRVGRRLSSTQVVDLLKEAFLLYGKPKYLRTDGGPEFTSNQTQEFLQSERVEHILTTPGHPWENGIAESWVGKTRREALAGLEPSSSKELERELLNWMRFYNGGRLHSSLGYRTPREAWEEGLRYGAGALTK